LQTATVFQCARGKNRGLEDRAATFIDDAEPTNLVAVTQRNLIGSVHLPNLMRPLRSFALTTGTTTAWRGRQCRTPEPALEGAFRRQPLLGMPPTQEDTDQASAPGGMLTAQMQGLVDQLSELQRERISPARIRSNDCIFPLNTNALQQMTHGTADKTQGTRNRRHALTPFGTSHNHSTQRQRNRMWHEHSSLEKVINHEAHGTVSAVCSCGKTS